MNLKDLDKSHAYFTSGLYDLVEDSFYARKGDFLNFLKTIKTKDAAPGFSNSIAGLVLPSTAQSTNVSFQTLPKVGLENFLINSLIGRIITLYLINIANRV